MPKRKPAAVATTDAIIPNAATALTCATATAGLGDAPPTEQISLVKKQKRTASLLVPAPATSLPELRAKAGRIVAQLEQLFPNPPIPLNHGSTFQLLVAVMLSAQTTDIKVNEVTPALFERGPDAQAMSVLPVDDVQSMIRVLGLAPTKAKNVVAMSKLLVERHEGEVPNTFEALEALPGVGHKTASVVMTQAFGMPAFPVDTHIHRLATRWGLTSGKSVEQTEADLKALLPQETWHDAHLQMIYFGRQHCPAQRHDVSACPICSWAAVQHPAAAADDAATAGKRASKKASGDQAPASCAKSKAKDPVTTDIAAEVPKAPRAHRKGIK